MCVYLCIFVKFLLWNESIMHGDIVWERPSTDVTGPEGENGWELWEKRLGKKQCLFYPSCHDVVEFFIPTISKLCCAAVCVRVVGLRDGVLL